jgi:hypothetical protein
VKPWFYSKAKPAFQAICKRGVNTSQQQNPNTPHSSQTLVLRQNSTYTKEAIVTTQHIILSLRVTKKPHVEHKTLTHLKRKTSNPVSLAKPEATPLCFLYRTVFHTILNTPSVEVFSEKKTLLQRFVIERREKREE